MDLSLPSPPHLWGKKFAHVAVLVSCMEAELCGPGLGAKQTPLSFRWTVDLVVDVFAGVHVETRVEEGAVAKALICVFVDDATEQDKVQEFVSFGFRIIKILKHFASHQKKLTRCRYK